ncbi:hypothetical protein [Ferviditalea candida]|uniref:Uncharacterized protein n=1 Tax=Ferviditalea candida TaxID=3108399 RepID=A0ABU5ZHC6_9BACL|nr:hypothetical protein [Paenibacillaceae bacterium T2]
MISGLLFLKLSYAVGGNAPVMAGLASAAAFTGLGWMMRRWRADTGLIERKPAFRFNRPLIFRDSAPLFRSRTSVHVLTEHGIKTLLRRWKYVKFLLQLTSIGVIMLLMLPFWWGIPVFILMGAAGAYFGSRMMTSF